MTSRATVGGSCLCRAVSFEIEPSALGGRVELYERFYLASAPRNLALDHALAQRSGDRAELPAFLAAAGIE